MYCEVCGKNIPDESKFCEHCGSLVNSEAFHSKEDVDKIMDNEEIEEVEVEGIHESPEEGVIKISENITKDSEGNYSWMYEFSLWKNPAVLITVFKVLLIALMVPALLMFLLTLEEGIGEALRVFGSILIVGGGLMTLLLLGGYVLLALAYGGKYYVLFRMDKGGINHIQLDKQHKKAEALGFLTALIGASTNNISMAGAGLLGASKKSLYTSFKKVKSIKLSPRTNTVYLNERLNKNQVYASREDFQLVKDFILENCPRNIRIIEK